MGDERREGMRQQAGTQRQSMALRDWQPTAVVCSLRLSFYACTPRHTGKAAAAAPPQQTAAATATADGATDSSAWLESPRKSTPARSSFVRSSEHVGQVVFVGPLLSAGASSSVLLVLLVAWADARQTRKQTNPDPAAGRHGSFQPRPAVSVWPKS
jgi:hypothetical protein